jgi:hypothetical protein
MLLRQSMKRIVIYLALSGLGPLPWLGPCIRRPVQYTPWDKRTKDPQEGHIKGQAGELEDRQNDGDLHGKGSLELLIKILH